MTYPEFLKNKELQEAAAAYEARFGGRFVCSEPGDDLIYLDANGDAYGQLDDYYTEEKLLQVFQNSLERQRPRDNIRTLWVKLDDEDFDPEILY